MRLATGAVLLDTGLPGLVFSDQFLQLPVRLPAGAALYGLGEVAQVLHCSPLYLTNCSFVQSTFRHKLDRRRVWPMWAADQVL